MTRRAAREAAARVAATGEVTPLGEGVPRDPWPAASAPDAPPPAAFGSGPFTAGPFEPQPTPGEASRTPVPSSESEAEPQARAILGYDETRSHTYGRTPDTAGAAPLPTFPAAVSELNVDTTPVAVVASAVLASPDAAATTPATSEPPTTTGLIGLDGQPMSRRRLREQRETQLVPIVGAPPQPSEPDTAVQRNETQPVPLPSAPQPTVSAPDAVPSFPPPAAGAAAPAFTQAPPFASTAPVAEASAAAPVVAEPSTAEPDRGSEPPSWIAPEGHWTRQLAEVDDESAEPTASRDVGSSPQTTSAILVVDHPAVMDLGGPLNATGEVLLTGSIPLSPGFARTGATGSVTDAELDDHFDTDRVVSPDVQPVKASAVASQHALGSPIVANAARRGGRGMTVLLVTASVLAVLVTGLVVTAIALNWFSR